MRSPATVTPNALKAKNDRCGGKKILLCHGHEYGVKSGYLNLQYAAREKGADIVLFGHTHQVFYDQTSQLAMLNPGSIGEPRYYGKNSYGILIIENGRFYKYLYPPTWDKKDSCDSHNLTICCMNRRLSFFTST